MKTASRVHLVTAGAMSIAALGLPFSGASAMESSAACDARRAAIEAQIAEASTRGLSYRMAGLKKALESNQATCTDASLAQERDEQVEDAQRKVADREKSLAEAEFKGDARKIATRKKKLEEARIELVEAMKPLAQ